LTHKINSRVLTHPVYAKRRIYIQGVSLEYIESVYWHRHSLYSLITLCLWYCSLWRLW